MDENKQPMEQEETPDLTPETTPEQETQPIETPVENQAEAPTQWTAPAQPEQKPGWTTGKVVGLVCGILALCVVLGVALWFILRGSLDKPVETDPNSSQTEDPETHTDLEAIKANGSYAYTDESLAEKYNDLIVAKVGDYEMNGAMFQIFYWSTVYSYLNSNADYISYLGPDTSKSLAEQDYGEDVTWEQHFVESALEMYLQNMALYNEAVKNNVSLTEDEQVTIDEMGNSLTEQATQYGFATADEYLAQSFGPDVHLEDYQNYYRFYQLAYSYATQMQSKITLDKAEVNDYYDANAENYASNGVEKIDKNVVNVRHVLIQPEQDQDSDGDGTMDASSEAAWAAAELKANELYETWKAEDPTEDSFAAMAKANSSDTGSTENGGLYEGIAPGQMVQEFNDWCFDDARKTGDNDIVKTTYGYHIMYYVGEGDYIYWYAKAESDCIYEKFDEILNDVFDQYKLETNYENLHIYDVIAVNAAAQAATAADNGDTAASNGDTATAE